MVCVTFGVEPALTYQLLRERPPVEIAEIRVIYISML